MSTKVTDFIEKLHRIQVSGLEDIQDVSTLFFALMVQYGVRYKQPSELQEWVTCVTKYRGDVEGMFMDEVNTMAHDRYSVFEAYCMEYMDFTKMFQLKARRVA